MLDTAPSITVVQKAIKEQKWDRSSYEYALNTMLPHHIFSDSSIYKKADLIKLFYDNYEAKWNTIKGFTTFRDLIYVPGT